MDNQTPTIETQPTVPQHAVPPPPESNHEPHAEQPHKPNRWLMPVVIVIAVVLLVIGILPRLKQQKQLNTSAAAANNALPIVNVVHPKLSGASGTIDVPGTINAVMQSNINARATGYVSRVLVDIGDKVKAGQTLAIITSPDTDQQTVQGRAQLQQSIAAYAQAEANLTAMHSTLVQQEANLGHYHAAYIQALAQVDQQNAQLAQARQQYQQQAKAVSEQQANTNLANNVNDMNKYLYQNGAIAKITAEQAEASQQVNQAALGLNQSALAASQANIKSYQENVVAGKANAAAAQQDIGVARAEVATAESNINAAQASVTAAMATVNANRAALARLVVLQGYEVVKAPFDGIVTARNVDPGAYISSGASPSTTSSVGSGSAGASVSGSAASGSSANGASSASTSSTSSTSATGGTSTGMFTVASVDRLRIYLNMPQNDADAVHLGQTAKIVARPLPLKTFTGRISQTAGALDPTSRTLVTEVQLENQSGLLRPGMFADVKITVPHSERVPMVPDTAILTGQQGPQVVIVGKGGKLRFQNVTIGQDNGKTMQILAGITTKDRVVASPNYNLVKGEKVKVVKATPMKGKGGS